MFRMLPELNYGEAEEIKKQVDALHRRIDSFVVPNG